MEYGESREILHRVGHLYTDPTVKEETGPRLRDRGRVAIASSGRVSLLRVRADVRLNYTQYEASLGETTQRPVGGS